MDIHKAYLFEWGGVNDDVAKLAEAIAQYMWEFSSKQDKVIKYISRDLQIPYVEGKFDFNLYKAFKDPISKFGLETLDVSYTLYFFDDRESYEKNINLVDNAETYNDSSINIVSALVGGQFNDLIYQDIYHELEHSFEFAKGMDFDSERYDIIVNSVNDKNEIIHSAAMMMYFSYTFEQSAFAQQFYVFLKKSGIEPNLYKYLEVLYMNGSKYAEFEYHRNNVNHLLEIDDDGSQKKALDDWLQRINMNYHSFVRRTNYGFKRLKKKLYKVYYRYCIENRRPGIRESSHRSTLNHFILKEYRKRYNNIDYKEEKYAQRIF